ncbi:MAG: chemotaxis protein CheD [Candidatus Bathyarchaeota archaeon]|nr:chemotaxis protein CheD [Candidatus Bathyarchaeota archaeon]
MHNILEDIVVDTAQVKATQTPNRLVALGVGSCIVVTLYDPMLKVGAMAHAMLPDSTEHGLTSNPFKFADLAIDHMIRKMESLGSQRRNMTGKIVGGANMFPTLGHKSLKTGEENVLAVKEKLRKEGISLAGEVVGGSVGRSVEFDTASGIVTVRVKI